MHYLDDFLFVGTIPGPIIYGLTLDTSCLLWQEDCKGDRGSCFLYDAKTISWKIFILCFGTQFLALVFFLMALWSYRSPEDEKAEKTNIHETSNGKVPEQLDSNGEQTHTERGLNRLVSQSSQAGIIANESLPEYRLTY